MANKFYKTIRFLTGWWYKSWYHPKIIGKDNIPKNGSLIIACNHKNFLDPANLVVSTKRVIHFMAKDKYFEKNKFFKWMGCIKVKSDAKNEDAMNEAIELLNNEGVLGIFPEGTRNKTEELLQSFKFGAVSMAQKTDSYILPVGITGNYKFRSKDLIVRFGKPFKVSKKDNLEKVNRKLFEEVKKLMLENIKEKEVKK